jgi:hypothetical protein
MTDNACLVIIYMLDPRFWRQLLSYDVASMIARSYSEAMPATSSSTL